MNQPEDYCPYEITTDPMKFGLSSTHVDSQFGPLYIIRSEQTTAKVTLFLHGVGGNWTLWTPLLEAAQDSHALGDIILVDLPGFGFSDNTLGHLKSDVVGHELLRIIGTLGWSEIHLVGHSMGGFLALDIAANRHPHVKSVAVISGTYLSVVENVQRPLRTLIQQPGSALTYASMVILSKLGPMARWLMRRISHTRLFRKSLRSTFAHPDLLKSSIPRTIAYNIQPESFSLAAQNGKHYQPLKEWNKINIPFKALFGSSDKLIPLADMRRLTKALNNIETFCLQDTGHFAQVERPVETLNWLLGHNQSEDIHT